MDKAPSSVRIVGVGDPVTDIIVPVTAEFLESVTANPGGSALVDPAENAVLLSRLGATGTAFVHLPGGSAANVVRCLAKFCSAERDSCCLAGGVGADPAADRYQALLRAEGVTPEVVVTSTSEPSATSICLVTPDGQRTMRTCLGAAARFSPEHLPAAVLASCTLLHCEGYTLYRAEVARAAIAAARAAGALVSLDLASFEAVRSCGAALRALLEAGSVDVLFCNEDEARAVAGILLPDYADNSEASETAGKSEERDPNTDSLLDAVQSALLAHCRVVVCTLGARGAQARSAGGAAAFAPARAAAVVDTVGAGDYFCGAFLAAHIAGAPLQQCLEAGCLVGSAVVQHVGAQLPEESWQEVLGQLPHVVRRDEA